MPIYPERTKAARAAELLRRLEEGPSWSSIQWSSRQREEMTRAYRRWVETWVRPDVIDLIPQLKKPTNGS